MVAGSSSWSLFWSPVSGVRRVARVVAWSVAFVFGATVMAVGAPMAWAARGSIGPRVLATAATAKRVDSRPDVVSAEVTARAQGSPVEAEDQRTEFSTSWVNPDGTVTVRQSAGQVRFRTPAGDWSTVDLSMKNAADGTVTANIPAGLAVAGGSRDATGSASGNALVVTGRGTSRELVVGSPAGWSPRGKSVKKTGPTAAFPGVAPGVGVSVDARRNGFEQSVTFADTTAVTSAVPKTGPAAGRVVVAFPVKTKGLMAASQPDGSVTFTDARGGVVTRVAAPQAWDAAVDGRSGLPAHVVAARLDVVQHGKGSATLVVSVDKAWATDRPGCSR